MKQRKVLAFIQNGSDLDFLKSASNADIHYVRCDRKATLECDEIFAPSIFFKLRERLKNGEFDLVIASAYRQIAWQSGNPHLERFLRHSKRWLFKFEELALPLLSHLLKGIPIPVAIVNREDTPIIHQDDYPLLDIATCYFMRELPVNSYLAFLWPSSKNRDAASILRQPNLIAFTSKLRPISLGVRDNLIPNDLDTTHKQFDLFYSGESYGRYHRKTFSPYLANLEKAGCKICKFERPVDQRTFFEHCANSRLIWSPSGIGWDCFRHYEAALCGAVPVINYPTIIQHAPLEHGKHCFFYPPEKDFTPLHSGFTQESRTSPRNRTQC